MFATQEIALYYSETKPYLLKALLQLNELNFKECEIELDQQKKKLFDFKKQVTSEDILNEIFVLRAFLELMCSLSEMWSKIHDQKFSSSWSSLQDILDLLRLVRKFSKHDSVKELVFFEERIVELENLFPYKWFFSIGATVEWFECSICHKNIDTIDCVHFKGELYNGLMAQGIAHGLVNVDHVAMVKYPQDKRCVVVYEDNAEQFRLVRFLSELVTSRRLKPLDFGYLKFQKRLAKNEEYQTLSRNDICYCGSGKKFKRCCINKEFTEGNHVDIVAKPIVSVAEIF